MTRTLSGAPRVRVRPLVDVSELPDTTFGARSLSWWGTVGFMVIEGTTLAICVVAYLYLRANFVHWPPAGTPAPRIGIPIVQLAVMLASLVPMGYAALRARQLDLQRTRIALGIALAFKVANLVLRWFEFRALGTLWNSDAYGSITWMTLGFHTTLLLLDAAEDVGILLLLYSPRQNVRHFTDVTDDTFYWYFTVAAWIPLFVLLFLVPRWS